MKILKTVGTYVVVPMFISAAATAGMFVGFSAAGLVLDKIRPSHN